MSEQTDVARRAVEARQEEAISTGLPSLDRLTGGLRRGGLYVVASDDEGAAEALAEQAAAPGLQEVRATATYVPGEVYVVDQARQAQEGGLAIIIPTYLAGPDEAPPMARLPSDDMEALAAQVWVVETMPEGRFTVYLGKNRHGPAGRERGVLLRYDGERFSEPRGSA